MNRIILDRAVKRIAVVGGVACGKSTLADRIMEVTEAVEHRLLHEQMLDDMDI